MSGQDTGSEAAGVVPGRRGRWPHLRVLRPRKPSGDTALGEEGGFSLQNIQKDTYLSIRMYLKGCISYLKSSSFVRRKFKMGANAAGSLSINICK